MEKQKVNKIAANSKDEKINIVDNTTESNEHNNFYEDWDDEDLVEEYFSKRKSRVRRQNKSFDKSNKYDEEW